MNPPLQDRRGPHARREVDLDKKLEEDTVKWVVWLTKKRARLVTIGGLAGSVITLIGGAAAMKFFDPAKRMDRIETKVDDLMPRVTRVENGLAAAEKDRAEIKEGMRWMVFMQCNTSKRLSPTELLPPVCPR